MFDRLRSTCLSCCNCGFMALAAAALCGCYALSQANYLLFHTLVELSAWVIGCAVFIFFWNMRRYLDNGFFLFIAVACLIAGTLDLAHVLAYDGLSDIPGATQNESIQAKTLGRCIVSLSLLAAPLFLRRRINLPLMLAGYGLLLAVVLSAIFYWHVVPACYVPGQGATVFDHLARAFSGLAFLGAVAMLAKKRGDLDAGVSGFLLAAMLVNAGAEFMSTITSDLNGTTRVLAHLCQVVSLYLVYQALIRVSLTKLCDLAFRDLKQSQDELRKEPRFHRRDSGDERHAVDGVRRQRPRDPVQSRLRARYRLPGRRNRGPEPLGMPRSAGAEPRGPGDLR